MIRIKEKFKTSERTIKEAMNIEDIVRGRVRDKRISFVPQKSYFNLEFKNLVGWFANNYNLAEGWYLYKTTDAEKKEFGQNTFRSYLESKDVTNIIKINLATGKYAFIDNKAYLEGQVKFQKMVSYNRIFIEPTKLAYKEFNLM